MSGRPRPLEYWDERRHLLLGAARDEVAEVGVEGLTLERVARRAGVSKGSVQYAFGSKEQLLGELSRDTLFSIFSDGVAARVERAGAGIGEVLDGLSHGLGADEERLVALLSLMATARRSAATAEALAGFYGEADPLIADALRQGGLDLDDASLSVLVRGLRGVVLGMYVHWVVHPQGRGLPDVVREVRFVLDRLMAGVEARPVGGA
jgi:AcrR family transcriptional regulator